MTQQPRQRTKRGAGGRASPKPSASAEPLDPRFARVVAAFARDRAVGTGRMFSSKAVLNVNGKIFAMLTRGRFVAKLPKERVDRLVNDGSGAYFDPGHGRLMKEWIAVEGAEGTWVALAREARQFVGTGRKPARV